MDLTGFQPYRGYFYRVSAKYSAIGHWRCTVDIRKRRTDGVVEAVISHTNVPGEFQSASLARDASDAYARAMIDEEKFCDD
jgi:hypothetical protein